MTRASTSTVARKRALVEALPMLREQARKAEEYERRRHSTRDMLSPADYEQLHLSPLGS